MIYLINHVSAEILTTRQIIVKRRWHLLLILRSWNIIYQVRSRSNLWKAKHFNVFGSKKKQYLNRLSKISYSSLYLRSEIPLALINLISTLLPQRGWRHISHFPNMCSNIPASPAYGVYISQLILYARASSNYSDFLKRHLHLRNRLLDQGYKKIRLIRSLKKFIFRYQNLVEI